MILLYKNGYVCCMRVTQLLLSNEMQNCCLTIVGHCELCFVILNKHDRHVSDDYSCSYKQLFTHLIWVSLSDTLHSVYLVFMHTLV